MSKSRKKKKGKRTAKHKPKRALLNPVSSAVMPHLLLDKEHPQFRATLEYLEARNHILAPSCRKVSDRHAGDRPALQGKGIER
jgi:hypothetical protein